MTKGMPDRLCQHLAGRLSTGPPALLASLHGAPSSGKGSRASAPAPDRTARRQQPGAPGRSPPVPAPASGAAAAELPALRGGTAGKRWETLRETLPGRTEGSAPARAPRPRETLPRPAGTEGDPGTERRARSSGRQVPLPGRGHPGIPVPAAAPPRPAVPLPPGPWSPHPLLAAFLHPLRTPLAFSCILHPSPLRSPRTLLAHSSLSPCTPHKVSPVSFQPLAPSCPLLPLHRARMGEGGDGELMRVRPRLRHPLALPSSRRGTAPAASGTYLRAALRATSTGPWCPLCVPARGAIAAGARGAQRGAAPGGAAMGRLRRSGARGGGTPASARRRPAQPEPCEGIKDGGGEKRKVYILK